MDLKEEKWEEVDKTYPNQNGVKWHGLLYMVMNLLQDAERLFY